MVRLDGRAFDELRPVQITSGFQVFAEGSAVISMGQTRVLCAVSLEDRVPPFLKGTGTGWVTAEYAMLPRSTHTRTPRDSSFGRVGGRNQEIQRLIGRSLRAVTDMTLLGERTLTVDCDVLQADAGTRTAAITGSYVALAQALRSMVRMGVLRKFPLKSAVAAVSVGVVQGQELLDLCYEEDSRAEVDFNVVMTGRGDFVEIQGTAETVPYSRDTANSLISMAEKGIKQLLGIQESVLKA
ncbi:MAG: ribonuclease [Dehalococcoidia bacterium]|nr:ribonuclease [Dehalococcoidia bacterium]